MKILRLMPILLLTFSAKAQLLPGASPYGLAATSPYGGLTSQLANITALTLYPSIYGNSFQQLYNAQTQALLGQNLNTSFFNTPLGPQTNPLFTANYGLGSTGYNPYVYNGGRFHTGISALGYGAPIGNDPNFGSVLSSFGRPI